MKRFLTCAALVGCSAFGTVDGDVGSVYASVDASTLGPSDAGTEARAPPEAGPSRAVTLRSSNQVAIFNATSISVPLPSDVQVGDLLVALVDAGDSVDKTQISTTPGWTKRSSAPGPSQTTYTYVFTRIATGGDAPFVASVSKTYVSGVAWVFDVAGSSGEVSAVFAASQSPKTSVATSVLPEPPIDGDLLIAAYVGFTDEALPISWSAPDGFTPISSPSLEKRTGIAAFTIARTPIGGGPFHAALAKTPVLAFSTMTLLAIRHGNE